MAVITKTQATLNGHATTYAAATAGGDTFANTGRTLIDFKNGSASALTVTINSVQKCNFGFNHDIMLTVPANGELLAGPFSTARFGTSVEMTYSGVTSLTVAAIETV